MALEDFLRIEFLAFIVAILVPFGIAMYRLGVLDTKIKSNRTLDHGSSVRTAQNDKLVRK